MNRFDTIRNNRFFYDVILFAVAVGLYSPTLLNGFVGDDYVYFIGNRAISTFDLRTIMLHGAIGSDYCPLRDLAFALDFKFWGARPFGFHLTNIILYGITAVAVKYLFAGFTNLLADRNERREHAADTEKKVFWVALLFAIHPVHREVVYAIYNRGALLTTLFCIFSCLAFMRFLRDDSRKVRNYAIALFCCLLAFMSREYGIILPLLLVVLVLCHEPSRRLSMLYRTIPFFIAAALFYYKFKKVAIAASYISTETEPFISMVISKVLVAFKIMVYYPVRLLPVEIPVRRYFGTSSDIIDVAAVAIVAGVLIAAFAMRRRYPILLLSLLLYLSCLIPVLNFFKTNPIVSDRYAYLPSLGLFFALTAISLHGWRRYVPVALVALTAAWVMVTLPMMSYWKNDVAYWSKYVPIYRYASLYARLGAAHFRNDNLAAAREAFTLSRTYSNGVTDDLLIGDQCVKIGYHEGAILAYQDAIKKSRNNGMDFPVGFYTNLATAYYATRDFERAIVFYERALAQLKSGFANGEFYSNLATSYNNIGDFRNALRYFERAIESNPRVAVLHNNVGALHAEMGNFSSAVRSFEAAIALDPGYGPAYLNLARVYRDTENVAKNMEYSEVLRSRFPQLLRELQENGSR
ncbi:MAG: tetratricopeptide repeat protein [Pelobacteraceae bacterium]